MSYEIKFDGYVAEVKQFTWGVAMKVIHNVRTLNDAGQWETSSKEYVDVVLPVGTSVQPDTRVTVIGKVHQLGAYLSKTGEPKPTLKVKALSVTEIPTIGQQTVQAKLPVEPDDLPF
jgi:hypothetical protein